MFTRAAYRPHLAAPAPDPTILAASRERRLKEIATSRVTREIIAYVTYLVLLILVAGHNRDSRSFLWTSSIRTMLNSGPTVAQVRSIGNDISSSKDHHIHRIASGHSSLHHLIFYEDIKKDSSWSICTGRTKIAKQQTVPAEQVVIETLVSSSGRNSSSGSIYKR